MKKSLLILAFLLSSLNANDKINIMTQIFPPFQFEKEGQLIGISTDIVNAIQKKLGSKSSIKVLPWNRGVKILNKKKNTALFSMLRTPERENKYKWVGPLTSMKLVFFKRTGSKIVLNTMEDAKKVGKIGVTSNTPNYTMLKKQGFKNLDVISGGKDLLNIKKLVKGRIDLWPMLLKGGLYNAKDMGFEGKITPIENLVIFSGSIYLAFSSSTSDTIIKQWQDALDMLKTEGSIEKITQKYQ